MALALYDAGRSKKTVGNILFPVGVAFIVDDLVNGANRDITYPTTFTYLGYACLLIAIPVKIGFSNKIEKAVNLLNQDSTKIKKALMNQQQL